MPGLARGGLRGGAVVVIAVAALADPAHLGLPFGPGDDLDATAGPSAAQRDAHRVARRYVRALRAGDGPLACSVAAAALRADRGGPCAGGVEALAGPVPKVEDPVLDGRDGRATVRVRRGDAPVLRLLLRRERGAWRVAALDGR